MCIASAAALRRDGDLRQARLRRGRDGRDAARRALRARGALFWVLVIAGGGGAGDLRGLARRDLLIALGAGGVRIRRAGRRYFAALQRIDASLLSLLLYTFPAMVAVAAILLGRERPTRRRFAALALASGGLVLVLAGAGAGALDPLGVGLAPRGGRRLQRIHPHSQGIAGRMRRWCCPRSSAAARPDAHRRLARARRAATRRRDRSPAGAGCLHRGRLDGRRGEPVLRRAEARRSLQRGDPLDRRAGGDRDAGLPRLRRDARRRCSCSAACS